MKQKLSDVLAIELSCPANIAVGDVVTISASKEVIKLAAAGALNIVGTVCVHKNGATSCTIETRFRERRDDRVSGAAVPVGPFVWDATGKVIAYDANNHDPAAIAGLVITPAGNADEVVETLEY